MIDSAGGFLRKEKDKNLVDNLNYKTDVLSLFFKSIMLYYLLVKPVGAFYFGINAESFTQTLYSLRPRENISCWRVRHMLSFLEMSRLLTGSTKNK